MSRRPSKLYAAVVVLPRWFVAPFVVSPIILGVALTHAWSWRAVLAVLAGLAFMVGGHAYNSFYDWAITKLDKGARPAGKPYTGHQSVIADGILSVRLVAAIAAIFLALFGLLTWSLLRTGPEWFFVGVGLVVMLVWYSEAKKWWHPELPLALGFGPLLVWLGMSASGSVDWWRGFLAAIPFMLTFGIIGTWVDQYLDYKTDWPKGARSFGMWLAHRGWPLWRALLPVMALAYVVQVALVLAGILSLPTLNSYIALFPFGFSLYAFAVGKTPLGVRHGLLGLVAFHILLAVGQVIGG